MEEAAAAASIKATMLGTKRARSEEESEESDGDDDDDGGIDTDDGTPETGGGANTNNSSKTKKNKNSKGAAAPSKVGRSRDGFTTDPSKLAMMSRSERKRHREKKRRSDVNKGFEDLTNLLVEVDAGVRMEVEEERARRLQAKAGDAAGTTGSNSNTNTNTNTNHKSKKALLSLSALASGSSASLQGDDNVLSRVDLIDRATTVLRRLHTENEQRKVLIEHLMAAQGQRGINVNVAPDLSSSASSPFFLFGHEPSSWVRVRSRLTRMGSGCGTYHDSVCCSQRTAYTLAVFVLPCRFSGTLLRRVTEACQRTRPC
jgi:Helix-loop-helix DNA-binding domain